MISYPNLTKERYLVVDVETHDPMLKKYGTNAVHRARGGKLLGFAVYTPSGFNEYYQYEGPDSPAARWLEEQIRLGPQLVGANLKYDLLWLLSEGMWSRAVAKRRHGDVLINASLLDENAKHTHNLNSQATIYGFTPKKNDELLAAGQTLGLKTIEKVKENMHLIQEMYPDLIAAYGKHDAYLTGRVWESQLPLLDSEGLTDADSDWRRKRPEAMPVVELEERFLPILALMEAQGIRVDVRHAQELSDKLLYQIEEQKQIIKATAGYDINYNPSGILRDYVEKNCPGAKRGGKKNEIKTGDTELAPFASDPVIAAVLAARKLSKMQGTFIKGYVLDRHVNGRLYPNIYQLATEAEDGAEGGTGTGRQSYSKPNLQNMPIRNKEWGPLLRQIVIADDDCQLVSLDFSQQEPRWAVTWCVRWGIPGAAEAAQQFINNPDTDWHGAVAAQMGDPVGYRDAGKVLVLATMYEQGEAQAYNNMLAAGMPPEGISPAREAFMRSFGFLKVGSRAANHYAAKHGFVRTWSGRKRRFDLWEPKLTWAERQERKEKRLGSYPGLPREQAMKAYFHGLGKPIQRYKTYPAFNAVVQGSSADQTKQVTIAAFYADDLIPNLEVHDEVVDGKIDKDDIIDIYKFHMLNTIKLAVPNKVGIKVGRHWQK